MRLGARRYQERLSCADACRMDSGNCSSSRDPSGDALREASHGELQHPESLALTLPLYTLASNSSQLIKIWMKLK
ncbi:hypothetical protein chiPu_0013716 [Chiloscyllium punctatum]|uniref:Uncharacterized protein n=1 Tax=Chiloscyllium punctatum TaxID=137246 RepID=A0A401SXX2_CHIPU|nr:hypothetical protein [Chiloscyllium punctatum]